MEQKPFFIKYGDHEAVVYIYSKGIRVQLLYPTRMLIIITVVAAILIGMLKPWSGLIAGLIVFFAWYKIVLPKRAETLLNDNTANPIVIEGSWIEFTKIYKERSLMMEVVPSRKQRDYEKKKEHAHTKDKPVNELEGVLDTVFGKEEMKVEDNTDVIEVKYDEAGVSRYTFTFLKAADALFVKNHLDKLKGGEDGGGDKLSEYMKSIK